LIKIFLSYSRKNEEVTTNLARHFEALGHVVWFDQGLSGGQVWWDKILEHIRQCDVFVFVLSPEALESAACKLEYNYAHDLNKPILPVLVAEEVNINLLPSVISRIHFVDYRRKDINVGINLAKALNRIPPAGSLPEPLPKTPEAPISQLAIIAETIDITSELSYEQQSSLVLDLKQGLRNLQHANDARILLERLRKRRDLYSSVAEEIEDLLNIDGKSTPHSNLQTTQHSEVGVLGGSQAIVEESRDSKIGFTERLKCLYVGAFAGVVFAVLLVLLDGILTGSSTKADLVAFVIPFHGVVGAIAGLIVGSIRRLFVFSLLGAVGGLIIIWIVISALANDSFIQLLFLGGFIGAPIGAILGAVTSVVFRK